MSLINQTCSGMYCGRTFVNGLWSGCGACPRGFRSNSTSHCVECLAELTLYDWLYLGIMALLPMGLHFYFIDMVEGSRKFRISQLASAFDEVVCGTLLALFVLPPFGSLRLYMCQPTSFFDWYPMFLKLQSDEMVHFCTQEDLYPLYAVVLLMYAFGFLMTVTLRTLVLARYKTNLGIQAIKKAFYYYPILVFIHTFAAGFIYYSFPYITIFMSMMMSASYFAVKMDQPMSELLSATLTNIRNLIILIGHWIIHTYVIVSVTGFKEMWYWMVVLAPGIYYIVIAHFTDPSKIIIA